MNEERVTYVMLAIKFMFGLKCSCRHAFPRLVTNPLLHEKAMDARSCTRDLSPV
jgi:hypothetical protein